MSGRGRRGGWFPSGGSALMLPRDRDPDEGPRATAGDENSPREWRETGLRDAQVLGEYRPRPRLTATGC